LLNVFVTDMGTFKDASEKKVSVEAGQVAVLDMPAIESHPAPLVTWFTDGEAQLYDRKFAVTAKNQLIILDASPSDQKAYR
jgi:protein sidekick